MHKHCYINIYLFIVGAIICGLFIYCLFMQYTRPKLNKKTAEGFEYFKNEDKHVNTDAYISNILFSSDPYTLNKLKCLCNICG